jgi:hypothetical protein
MDNDIKLSGAFNELNELILLLSQRCSNLAAELANSNALLKAEKMRVDFLESEISKCAKLAE